MDEWMDGWMKSSPGKTVTIHDIPGVVKAAQEVSITSLNIVSGFKNTGIYPFNRHIYTEDDFVSTDVYDQPILAEAMNSPMQEPLLLVSSSTLYFETQQFANFEV